jgi:hypothetical protein
MNLGSLLVLFKLAVDSGFTVSPKTNGPTPPTADVGLRPPDSSCGEGMKIVFKENPDRWVCVPKFD